MTNKSLLSTCLALLITIGQAVAEEQRAAKTRSVEMTVSAEIVDIDYETREISLKTPMGQQLTLTADEQVQRLAEFAVGDTVVATYFASLEGDLRKPTAAEMDNPWIVLDAAAIASLEELPGAAAGRVIQAVCTIEGMNRVLGTVTIMDPRGKLHVIGDVEAEDMAKVTLGETVIVTFSQAVALTLEKAGE